MNVTHCIYLLYLPQAVKVIKQHLIYIYSSFNIHVLYLAVVCCIHCVHGWSTNKPCTVFMMVTMSDYVKGIGTTEVWMPQTNNTAIPQPSWNQLGVSSICPSPPVQSSKFIHDMDPQGYGQHA